MQLKHSAVVLAFVFAASASAASRYEFDFWPQAGAEKDPRFVELREGPCGPVAVARVQAIPSRNDLAFESEAVYELSKTSRVLRRWQVPLNAVPVAVAGKELVFRFGLAAYKTNQAGAVSRVELQPIPESEEAQCKMPSVFLGSAYARCLAVPRLGSQRKAVLAVQAPCT